MGNAQKALVMAAGIFLAIALITIAVVLFISAQEATKTAQNNFSNIQTELSQTAYTVYDNTVVSGSQVVNALRKFADKEQFGIQIVTGKNRAGSWYGKTINTNGAVDNPDFGSVVEGTDATGNLTEASDESKKDYVNPSGKFKAKIVTDRSNVIRGIIFEQN
ncbi:ABC transporter permease [Paenibacillus selenitireducens]|uniref:ABC transporter permease n=1 Tax=Paenibacillus selenitireducens TaxID=1324314 RepID=A0A1T2X423_9BACL|nr:ABC transporter permease [Paenibacillus selenitireducens]OPA74651.1 ABC transporter permease [Paenibacillus selenitireducens]